MPAVFGTPPRNTFGGSRELLARYVTIKPCTARSRKTRKSYTQFRPDD
jgi:hypothetical protein